MPRSRRAPTFHEHGGVLRQALGEVAENSFFAFVSDCDAELFVELAATPAEEERDGRAWLVTRVPFAGAFAGTVSVTMPVALARSLLAAFVGLEPDAEVEAAAVTDAVGEFCNMVCGAWLTRACQRRRFDLRPPVTQQQPAGWAPERPAPPAEYGGDVLVTVNDLPLRVRLEFEPEWS